jgi:hypothetical protein
VVTRSGAVRPIKWIGRRSYSGRFIMGRKDILPVCIKAGALDDNVSRRDLCISPHHAMKALQSISSPLRLTTLRAQEASGDSHRFALTISCLRFHSY